MTSGKDQRPVRHLFDVRLDAMTMDDVLRAADEAVASRRRMLVGVVNAAKLVNMNRDAALRRAVLGSDVILADGMSVYWACKLLMRALPERVAGIDLLQRLLARASERRYRVFLLGAKEEVLAAVVERIGVEHPGVQLVGRRNGYFKPDEDEQVAHAIRESKADMLFVGITSPRKETFLANWAPTMGVPVCHGVGGAFDVMAGKVKRAPDRWQRMGMEWLYRVKQEPRRLWRRYLVTNLIFAGMVLRELGGSVARRLAPAITPQEPWDGEVAEQS